MNNSIKKILNKLEKNGFEAYVVGGYVRDYLLNITSYDVDICTNAKPKELIKIFDRDLNPNTKEILKHNSIGTKFNVIHIIKIKEKSFVTIVPYNTIKIFDI